MKKQRRVIGSVLKVVLDSGLHSYIRVLDKASVAVYDILTQEEITIDDIVNEKVIFIVAVYKNAITSGNWVKVGTLELEESLLDLPMQFIQDTLDGSIYSLYNPNTGTMTYTDKSNCVGLERASVWAAHHLEDRISDHFAGRECKWVKKL
jgi:Immunity protein 26